MCQLAVLIGGFPMAARFKLTAASARNESVQTAVRSPCRSSFGRPLSVGVTVGFNPKTGIQWDVNGDTTV